MKRGACILLALLAGCPRSKTSPDAGPVDAGPAQLTEHEPNDRPEDALSLNDSAVVSAQLETNPSKPDEDWYLLAPSSPRTVDLAVSGIPGADVALDVYDVDRNRLLTLNSEGVGKPERLPNLGVKGRLYLKVYSARKGAGGAYTLTALFKEPVPGFEWEPNDRAADANLLTLGQPISAFIGHAADEDWYRLELPGPDGGAPGLVDEANADGGATVLAPGPDGGASPTRDGGEAIHAPSIALKVDLTAVEGVRFEVQVLSAAQAPLFQIRGKEGEGLSLRNIGVRENDRTVYLVIKSGWIGVGKEAHRGYNSEKPYTLTVVPEEAGANAELEPNDDIFKATPLPLNGFREGFLSPKTDVDYYVLKTEQPVLARFHLSGVDRLDLMLSVVAPEQKGGEKVLLRANDGAVKEPEILNSVYCAGQCWVKVEGALRKVNGKFVHDFENAEEPYRLTVSTSPDNGTEEREPNNTAEQATPIQIGRPIRGTIQPKKDVDFYRLDLSGRPVRVSIKATATGLLKVHLGLYLHRLNEEGKLSLVQTADQAKGDAPEIIRYSAEPGVYFFEVRDSKNRESNFQDFYQLTVEEGD
jgi:hypothetical protein